MLSFPNALGIGTFLGGWVALASSLSSCATVPPASASLFDEIGGGPVRVRLVHASPTQTQLALTIDGQPADQAPVSFGGVGEYVNLTEGDYNLGIAMPGTTTAYTPLTQRWVTLPGRRTYTVVALDEIDRVQTIVLSENLNVDSNKVLMRFVHAVPDAPALDWVQEPRLLLADGLEFGQVSGYVEVDPGLLTLTVRSTERSSLREDFDLNLAPGRLYTLYITGLVRGGDGLDLVESEDETLVLNF